jgi:hypothetical protein
MIAESRAKGAKFRACIEEAGRHGTRDCESAPGRARSVVMNRLQRIALRIAQAPLPACTKMLLAASIATIAPGCSSDSKTTTASTTSTPDAGAPLDDPGAYGACTSASPTEPAPDLNGRWAIRTVASRYVPATGLTSAFYTTTTSVLLADQTQTGTDLSISAAYCDQRAADPKALAHVVIPDSYKRSLKPFVRTGSYAIGDAGAEILSLPNFVEVEGATLVDPANDALPTDATDPLVTDQDQDGNPGITIKLSGIVSGDLYVVQRQKSVVTGIAVTSDRIAGHYEFTSEQIVLDSNPATLKPLAAQTAITDPLPCASTYTAVRVAAEASCADVLANSKIFD